MTQAVQLAQYGANNVGLSFKNRIINGDMGIDQRNSGASVTPAAATITYTIDRWLAFQTAASKFSVRQNAGSVTPPAGFTNYLGITSLSSYSSGASDAFLTSQYIEGLNIADLGWGTANAQAVTVSFWVRSSLTGTFSFSVCNFDSTRNYISTYTVSSANTWEYKTVTIAGDTSGTWLTNTSIGLQLRFDLGSGSSFNGTAGAWSASNQLRTSGSQSVVGTNGATFYITGVQLEKGTVATSFDYLPYGTELMLCQRYLPAWIYGSGNDTIGFGYSFNSTQSFIAISIPVTPRVAPTGLTVTGAFNMTLRNGGNTGGTPGSITTNVFSSGTNQSILVQTSTNNPTLNAGDGAFLFASGASRILFTGCEL
jgi:hypothetical protein